MTIWQRPFTLEEASASRAGTMMETLGIELVEIGEDYLRARMPVDQRTRQVFGILHGGASCALAETVGSIGAYYCLDKERYYSVGLEINTSHVKMVRSGFVYGTAKPFHMGRSTQLWEILIHDEAGQLISVNRLRMAVLEK